MKKPTLAEYDHMSVLLVAARTYLEKQECVCAEMSEACFRCEVEAAIAKAESKKD